MARSLTQVLLRPLLALLALQVAVPLNVAQADGRALESLDSIHEACADAREQVNRRLYVVEVEEGWSFGALVDGHLAVNTGRNFRALDGHVSLLVPRTEELAFEATPEEVSRLRGAHGRLRVGFFLGFDNRSRQPCLVRNRFAVTIVRADVAYLELVDERGVRLARAETDRLRAWSDDQDELAIEGSGPRGAVGVARFSNGSAPPEGWQSALAAAALRSPIGRCHAEGIERGAAREGQLIIRLNVESRTGRVRRADVALSSLGEREEAECIARALGAVTLSRGPTSWQAEYVDLAVPVRVVAD